MYKNITFSLDDALIFKARQKASGEKKSLSAIIKEWLLRYVGQETAVGSYELLMKQLDQVKSGKKFTREDMNER